MDNKIIKKLFFISSVLLIIYFLFSIIPLFNGFPTGIDAPHHIMWARAFINNTYPPEFMWRSENPSPYPIPEILFALINIYTGLSLEFLFPVVNIIFIIATLSIVLLITKKIFGFYAGILSFVLGSSMFFFVVDNISIGTISEVYGHFILFFIFYLFIVKKYYLTPLFVLIGYFSHPFVNIYIVIIILVFLPFILLNKKFIQSIIKHKYKIIITTLLFGLITLIALLIFGDQLKELKVIKMLTSDNLIITGGKAYSLDSILAKDNMSLLYILSTIGLILFISKHKKFNKYYFGLISVIFILMPFNNHFNINIEPYRFISYLSLFVAIFSSYFIILLYKKTSKKYRSIILPLIFILALLFSYNNISVAKDRVNEFSKNPLGKLPEEDLKLMGWMKDDTKTENNNYICSLYKWGHWIPAVAEKKVVYGGYENPKQGIISCNGIFNLNDKEKIMENAKEYNLKYVYFSSHQDLNLTIDENFELLKKEGGASIYQLY